MLNFSVLLFICIYFLFVLKFKILCSEYVESNYDNEKFLVTGGYYSKVPYIDKYIVSIRFEKYTNFFGDDHICGGTIISPKAILTAAHCFVSSDRPDNLSIVVATPNRLKETNYTKRYPVSRLRVHKDFDSETGECDIAILLVKGTIILDNVRTAIMELPKKPIVPYTVCTIAGWGRLYENGPLADIIMYANLSILDDATCMQKISGIFCAGDLDDFEKDACVGDSGGPLICKGVLTGVVSFGYGCGRQNEHGIYTDIYYYLKWIDRNDSTRNSVTILTIFTLFITSYFLRNCFEFCI